jgi:4-amino-4-deoxy-L-arabinose transferase-like glycosyltransferase
MVKNQLDYFNRNEEKVLLLLFFITIILRTIYVYISYQTQGRSIWMGDDFYYLYSGEQIAIGNWSPHWYSRTELIVAPIVPVLVAIFIRLFNDPVIPYYAYNILMTSLMVPVLYLLGKELLNKNTGWFLALWGLIYIEAFYYSPRILKEPTLYLFLPLTLLFLIRTAKDENPLQNIFFASVSFAYLIHTDERFFVFFPIFFIFFLFSKPLKTGRFAVQSSMWLFLVVLLMLPWGIRNYNVFNQLVILTPRTTAITSKFIGQDLSGGDVDFGSEEQRKANNARRYDEAMAFGKIHGITPREFGKNEARLRAFKNFWQPTYFKATYIQYGFRPDKWSLRHNISGLLFYGIFLPFFIGGMIVFYKRRMFLPLFIGSVPVIHSLVHAYMVWPMERYRSPINFIVVMIGVWMIFELYKMIKEHYATVIYKEKSIDQLSVETTSETGKQFPVK